MTTKLIIDNSLPKVISGAVTIQPPQEIAPTGVAMFTPTLVYQWMVTYKDGTGFSQFEDEIENNSRDINYDEVAQVNVLPQFSGMLPGFTFVRETGKFFKAGEEIDPEYPNEYPGPEAPFYYARKVTHTWGDFTHTTVLQLLGWKTETQRCIIAIDERGNWRPWQYD